MSLGLLETNLIEIALIYPKCKIVVVSRVYDQIFKGQKTLHCALHVFLKVQVTIYKGSQLPETVEKYIVEICDHQQNAIGGLQFSNSPDSWTKKNPYLKNHTI